MSIHRKARSSWFLVPTLALSACGFELAVIGGSGDAPVGADAAIPGSSSGVGTTSSSSSSSGVGGSSGDPDPQPTDAGSSTDADAEMSDADAAPPVLVCTPREAKNAFCNAGSSMNCLAASSDNPPWIPSGANPVGSAYFPDLLETAPFDLTLEVRFARNDDDRYGVVALFFGGDPAATTDLCTRLQALGPGEAAVLYRRKMTGTPTMARIVVAGEGCGDFVDSLYRGDDNVRDVTLSYDGTNLSITGDGLDTPVIRPVTLSPRVPLGVVGQRYGGSDQPVRVERIALTCRSPQN